MRIVHFINVRSTSLRLSAGALCVLCAASAAAETAMPEAAILRAQAMCAAKASPEERTECEQLHLAGIESFDEKTRRVKPFSDELTKACMIDNSEKYNDCATRRSARYPDADREFIQSIAYSANLQRQVTEEKRRLASIATTCKQAGVKPDSVRLGMTALVVRSCGWGEPESVNRTITSWSVSEQWVYGDGRYLYFRNGRLDAIQD